MTHHIDPAKPRVAIVEDDCDLRHSVTEYLATHGYVVWGVDGGEALYRRLLIDPVDVVILDIGLPGEDGFAITAHLRQIDHIGVVILSGRDGVDDRLTGLGCGADLYLVKPVDLRELAANIEAVWRRLARSARAAKSAAAPLDNAWRLDRERWLLVSPAEAAITLTSKEFLFLRGLFEAGGGLVTKADVAACLGIHAAAVDYHRIDVLVGRLRKKGKEATGQPLPIRTVTSLGYSFSAPCGLA